MSTTSFRTALTVFPEIIRMTPEQPDITIQPLVHDAWKFVNSNLYKHEVAPAGGNRKFTLKLAHAKDADAKLVYTGTPADIAIDVSNLIGTSLSEAIIYTEDSAAPSYAIYLVRRSLNLSSKRHVSQVIADIAEEIQDMGDFKQEDIFEIFCDLLTEDYHLLAIELSIHYPYTEATMPFVTEQLMTSLKPLLFPLLLAHFKE